MLYRSSGVEQYLCFIISQRAPASMSNIGNANPTRL